MATCPTRTSRELPKLAHGSDEPLPRGSSIRTTAGPTASTAAMTACEYASSSSASLGGCSAGVAPMARSYEKRAAADITRNGGIDYDRYEEASNG